MKSLVEEINVDLRPIENIPIEMEKIRRRLISANARLVELREKIDIAIKKVAARQTV